ncbi:MAG TPA: tagatose-6-phosphate ketose isomerase, partial [Candidatus Sulfotelmatobacter sp.]
MNALSALQDLPDREKASRGLMHTPAEIAQQPATWWSTFELFQLRQKEIAQFISGAGVGNNSDAAPTVLLIGAGTSDYIGLCLTHLLRKCWHCEVVAVPSTDLLTHMDDWIIPGREYLWISFSRSGDSPEGVAVLAQARKKYPHIRHFIVSCNAQGRMIRESSGDRRTMAVVLDDAVNDRGLAMTSSF